MGSWSFALGPAEGREAVAGLLDVLERAVIAFKARQRAMQEVETCPCNACRKIETLDLKIVVHYGTFLRQTVGGRSEVAGPDVIVVHRLLKNGARQSGAYLLLTEATLAPMAIDAAGPGLGLRARTERYEHLGAIRCFVCDLEPAWRQAQAPAGAQMTV